MADAADAPATDASDTSTDSTDTTETPDATLGAAGEKALGEFKTRARTAEKELKSTKAELDKLRNESMDEQQKAVAEARAEGRSGALKESGARLVDAEIRVAGVGRTFDTDALLALDRSTFITDDGDTDSEAIKAWVEEHSSAPTPEDEGPLDRSFDLGQGSSTNTPIGDNDAFEKVLKKAVGAR